MECFSSYSDLICAKQINNFNLSWYSPKYNSSKQNLHIGSEASPFFWYNWGCWTHRSWKSKSCRVEIKATFYLKFVEFMVVRLSWSVFFPPRIASLRFFLKANFVWWILSFLRIKQPNKPNTIFLTLSVKFVNYD